MTAPHPIREFVIDSAAARLDLYLAEQVPELTRSQVRRLIDEGQVLLNGGIPRPGRKLRHGDRVFLTIPAARSADLMPEAIPLDVVYQDGEVLVIDKPAGLTVHPGPGHPDYTLVNAILALCPDLKGIGGELRPGIVHRLDKDTSGLMVVAKDSRAHLGIAKQIKDRAFRKGYMALAQGRVVPVEGRINAPIGRDPRNRKRMAVVEGGRESSTSYRVLQHLDACSLLEVFPETGRTHQIRVHFASVGHPLVGDATYGNVGRSSSAGLRSDLKRQFLHAHLLGFRHPVTGEYLEFTSPLPAELRRTLADLQQACTSDVSVLMRIRRRLL